MNLDYIKKYMPNIELSYEPLVHNKVCDLFMAIPYGKKYIVWFTYYNNENVCLLIEYNTKNKVIINFEIATVSYNKYLKGTILYGTIIFHKNIKYFVTENIYYFKNQDIKSKSFQNKLTILNTIFSSYINNYIIFNKQLVIGMCLIDNNKNRLITSIENIDYNIFGILNRNSKNNYSYFTRYSSDNNYTNNNINIENNKRVIFSITPDIKNDIYNLNIYGPNGIVFYQYAYIPDYKTSVMMNNHFRIIKENTNLDLLEESDDEEEFENITPDKFVYLEKSLNFECIYNKKFKKWIPVKKTNEKKITNFTTLKNIIYK